ncbi:hypothetical protein ABW636_00850 [Aquimarina sp. 2201CG1-2-11]|uniref:hypothetical protein n=1 Tax=Aquimarina discodermiae TaxID=3231043 RepID=UPI0034620AD9
MKIASIKELKTELHELPHQDLVSVCLRLARFKKENKELLTYLLFLSNNEEEYIEEIKKEMDLQFEMINISSYHFIKKSIRKILRIIKKHIKYSGNIESEIELLLYFCKKLSLFDPPIKNNKVLHNMYHREISTIVKKIKQVHEDLQYDYTVALKKLSL